MQARRPSMCGNNNDSSNAISTDANACHHLSSRHPANTLSSHKQIAKQMRTSNDDAVLCEDPDRRAGVVDRFHCIFDLEEAPCARITQQHRCQHLHQHIARSRTCTQTHARVPSGENVVVRPSYLRDMLACFLASLLSSRRSLRGEQDLPSVSSLYKQPSPIFAIINQRSCHFVSSLSDLPIQAYRYLRMRATGAALAVLGVSTCVDSTLSIRRVSSRSLPIRLESVLSLFERDKVPSLDLFDRIDVSGHNLQVANNDAASGDTSNAVTVVLRFTTDANSSQRLRSTSYLLMLPQSLTKSSPTRRRRAQLGAMTKRGEASALGFDHQRSFKPRTRIALHMRGERSRPCFTLVHPSTLHARSTWCTTTTQVQTAPH